MSESDKITADEFKNMPKTGKDPKPYKARRFGRSGNASSDIGEYATYEEAEDAVLDAAEAKGWTGSMGVYGPDDKGVKRILFQIAQQHAPNGLPWSLPNFIQSLKAAGATQAEIDKAVENFKNVSGPKPPPPPKQSILRQVFGIAKETYGLLRKGWKDGAP